MEFPNAISRGQRALRAAQRVLATQTITQVMDHLFKHPCVSYVVQCGSSFDSGNDLSIAVQMLVAEANGKEFNCGRLRHDLESWWVRPESIAVGMNAISECASLLQSCTQPFAFLSHVHGQTFPQLVYGYQSRKEALSQIADALGQEGVRTVNCLLALAVNLGGFPSRSTAWREGREIRRGNGSGGSGWIAGRRVA